MLTKFEEAHRLKTIFFFNNVPAEHVKGTYNFPNNSGKIKGESTGVTMTDSNRTSTTGKNREGLINSNLQHLRATTGNK